MTRWLVHFSHNGKKSWTTVEANSYEKACSSLLNEGNVVLILHVEPLAQNEEVLWEEDWSKNCLI